MNKTTKVVVGSLVVATLSSVATSTILNKNHKLQKEMIIQQKQKLEDKYKTQIENLNITLEKKQNIIEQLEQDLVSKQKTLDNIKTQEIELTYYTTLPQENGGYTVTCEGKPLKEGIVASNYYPLRTKIIIEGRTFTVADRGGSDFNHPNRLDVLVERNPGENDEQYLKRVNNLGRTNVTAYIIK